jgi:hypothetical protein
MKAKIIVLTTILFFGFTTIVAQDISKLTVPTSPAFSILGFEPSAIMRPTNAKSLATDILNAFDKNGKLLVNLGLEVAPYWLKSNPNLTRKDYLRPSTGQAFMQSLSISAATVKDSASGNNKLSAGFRFRLYNGEPVAELETASNELKLKTTIVAIINGVKSIVDANTINTKQKAIDNIENALIKKNIGQATINNFKKDAQSIMADYTDALPDIKLYLEKLLANRIEAYAALAKKVSNLLYDRKGFILEFAGATGFNTTQNNSVEKIGFWGNASYNISPDDMFTLTARYMFTNGDTASNNIDIGLGFLKKNSQYNISFEGMARFYHAEIADININNQPIKRIEKAFTYRLAGQVSYAISKDVSINLNIGKDFNTAFISRSGFFSILGVNYSIFSKEPLNLK